MRKGEREEVNYRDDPATKNQPGRLSIGSQPGVLCHSRGEPVCCTCKGDNASVTNAENF